jgi:hypothetical protein
MFSISFGLNSSRVRELEKQLDCLQSNYDYVSEELGNLEAQAEHNITVQHQLIRKNLNEPFEPQLRDDLPEDLLETFRCPITMEIMEDPWMDYEGNTYEKNAILDALERERISPITRSSLVPVSNQLFPNRALKHIIDSMRK